MNLAAWLSKNGKVYPDRPALSLGIGGDVITYAQWAVRCRSLAASLARRRKAGDRVAIVMTNHPAFLEALFAIWHAGMIAVPINAKLHRDEFSFVIDNSGATLVITDDEHAASLNGLAELIVHGTKEWRDCFRADGIDAAETKASDSAWLFYTSGTTGKPKGATLSHRNLLAMSMSYYADIANVSPADKMIHPAPLSHGSGLYSLPFVARAAHNIVPESLGFDASETALLLKRNANVSFFAAPTMVRRLLDAPDAPDSAQMRSHTIVYGGAPMHVADLVRALERFGNCLAQIYAQGESPMTITALSKEQHLKDATDDWHARLRSAGIARTGVEVRIVDEHDMPVPPGASGEIQCRGDVVMAGYWRNPGASAKALRNGWLQTGDIGALGADGFLVLNDRSKDVIISGGSNVYPREVEEVLLRHPAVAEAAVIGRESVEWGEDVVAFVVARDDAAVAEADLDALCLSAIARFKRPKAYRFVNELPKNNYGKVLKTTLRDML